MYNRQLQKNSPAAVASTSPHSAHHIVPSAAAAQVVKQRQHPPSRNLTPQELSALAERFEIERRPVARLLGFL